jgi:ureidoglycolate lyase
MPAPTIISPPPSLRITPEPLTPSAFAPFGTVISSPLPRGLSTAPPATALSSLPLPHALAAPPILANQGSALKYSPVSPLENGYDGGRGPAGTGVTACPSGKRAHARMSMFSCFPREVRRVPKKKKRNSRHGGEEEKDEGKEDFLTDAMVGGDTTPVFDVNILERHPFTTQTFIPLGLSSQKRVIRDAGDREYNDGKRVRTQAIINGDGRGYRILEEEEGKDGHGQEDEMEEEEEPIFLVLVAPTLKGQSAAATEITTTVPPPPPPRTSNTSSSSSPPSASSSAEQRNNNSRVLIRDPPDLENLRAFVAHGGQAVTYAAGTWHAPMVVLGRRRVDFVVVQFVNGVEEEDCQEAAFREGIVVDLGGLVRNEEDEEERLMKGLLLGRGAKL